MFSVAVLQLSLGFPRQADPKPWHPNSLTHTSPSCRRAPGPKGTMWVQNGLKDLSCTLLSLGRSYSACKSNLYLAHGIIMLGSKSKKEMIWHSRGIRALQDLYKHSTVNPCEREKPYSSAWRGALAARESHWPSKSKVSPKNKKKAT